MSVGKKKLDAYKAATTITGQLPGDMGRSAEETYLKIIWCGIVFENTPGMTFPELMRISGHKTNSHSGVHGWIEKWRQMDWRVRHAWLLYAESLANHSFNVRNYQIDIDKMRMESLAEAAVSRRKK